ncbi:MAG TPA: carboxypeptidase-like regulatory domain-containing protein, partial [Anaerolineales bacterium]|nr:carboxypeptidase-like regulatory domain-containing protein [Anaerolineales bacterium]
TGRLMATKITTANGQFALVPPPGVYTVMVSKAGYEPYRESHVVVSPQKRAALSMTFNLTPAAPQALNVTGLSPA